MVYIFRITKLALKESQPSSSEKLGSDWFISPTHLTNQFRNQSAVSLTLTTSMKIAKFFRKLSLLDKLRPILPSFSGTASQQKPIRVQSIVKNGEFERALINSSLSKNEMRHLFRLMDYNCSTLFFFKIVLDIRTLN